MRAFQLLDDFSDSELSGNPAPGFVVGVVPVQHHEGIGMAQHPAQGMHGAFAEPDTGDAAVGRIIGEGVHIDQLVWTSTGIGIFTGPRLPLLQTVDDCSFQVMRRSVDQAMGRGPGKLRISAVPGAAMNACLPSIKRTDRPVDILQSETVHRAGIHKLSPGGPALLQVFFGIGVIGQRA